PTIAELYLTNRSGSGSKKLQSSASDPQSENSAIFRMKIQFNSKTKSFCVLHSIPYVKRQKTATNQLLLKKLMPRTRQFRKKKNFDNYSFVCVFMEIFTPSTMKDSTMSNCKNYTGDYAGAPELKAIKLYFCSWLTDEPISTLVKYCGSSLERIEIVGCGHISKKGIYPLEKCKKLKRLHLEYLPKISGLDRQIMLDSLNLAIGHHCKITYPFHTKTGMLFRVPTSDGIIK
uniref:Mitochondrial ATP synthase regulatory component factor B n=1 Tax=Romanomermis culicivorax TaxID=13658 RepID=A0A915K2T9_ROMCU